MTGCAREEPGEARGEEEGRGKTYFEDFEIWAAGDVGWPGGRWREGQLSERREEAERHDDRFDVLRRAERDG